MKIAFTGSPSTGKTTVADRLVPAQLAPAVNRVLNIDGRALLEELGHKQMDPMTLSDLQAFQLRYLEEKQSKEAGADSYLTERSFVDVAAFWVTRDDPCNQSGQTAHVLEECKEWASRYDAHILFPSGVLRFQPDGYRSENHDMHKSFDSAALEFLKEWDLPFLKLTASSIEGRVQEICTWLGITQFH